MNCNARKRSAAAALTASILTACGGTGGGGGQDGSTGAGADFRAAAGRGLCPASLDYTTVFTGAGGNGELVQMRIDTLKMTWQVTYVESPVPLTPGTAAPTRAGTTQSGTLRRETLLPTAQQNQCAFYLDGASLDRNRPARIFVGEGLLGGTIPGKRIQYAGIAGVGAIEDTTFPYYPFIGFSSLETQLSGVAGTYNQLGYHQVPSQGFAPVAIDATIAIHADGSWTQCDKTGANAGQCRQPGTNWRPASNGTGVFETDNFQGQVKPTLSTQPQAKGFLIVGKLRNERVPLLIRTGYANPDAFTADDESGIAFLSPASPVAVDSQNGQYIGVDSNFNYRATALVGAQATLLDPYYPSQAQLATALDLEFAEGMSGVVRARRAGAKASEAATGKLVFAGGVFGYLDRSDPSSPYFAISAFVQ